MTNTLEGRELAVTCAEAMGWHIDGKLWFDANGCCAGWVSAEPYPSASEMLAWLRSRLDTEALQRLVVAVAKRGSKSKETP